MFFNSRYRRFWNRSQLQITMTYHFFSLALTVLFVGHSHRSNNIVLYFNIIVYTYLLHGGRKY